jgi:oligopeptide transport system permease protein
LAESAWTPAGPAPPADWFDPAPPLGPEPPHPRPAPVPAARRLLRRPAVLGSLAVLALVAAFVWWGPHLTPWPYTRIDLAQADAPPSWAHWFGTDALGRDLFARTAVGGRVTLLVGLLAVGLDLMVGVVYGGVAAWVGGWLDEALMRLVDVLYAVPLLPLAVLWTLVFGRGLAAIVAAIALVNWLGMARLVRGQVLQLKAQEFVLAAVALGVPPRRIFTRHLLPHLAGPILAWLAYSVPAAIFTEAVLSYLGVGVQPPATSWGALISAGSTVFRVDPAPFAFAAAALTLTLLALYVLSDALADALTRR